jgi:tetratricopeptide (TPR) repeat protein
MASFSEYFEEARRNLARKRGPAPQQSDAGWDAYLSGMKGAAPAAQGGNPDFMKDPLGATLDFLSRPLYGVTNAVSGIVDDNVASIQKVQQGDAGGVAEMLGQVLFNPRTPGRLIEGLTTDQPDKKRFFSDVIEESTDKAGQAFNPDYVDRVDNVYGPLKGIAGFTADMALDPISYVPIPVGAIVKGARAVKGKLSPAAKTEEAATPAVVASSETPPAAPQRGGMTPREAMSIPLPEKTAAGLAEMPALRPSDALSEFLQEPPTGAVIRPPVAPEPRLPELPSAPLFDEKTFATAPTPQKARKTSRKKDNPEVVEAPKVAQAVAKAEQEVPSPRDEARQMWVGIADLGYAIDTGKSKVPITRDMVEQAVTLERSGELPPEWQSHLRFLREEAEINRPYVRDELEGFIPVGTSTKEREGLRAGEADAKASDILAEAALKTPENDAAAKWLAENDNGVAPAQMQVAKKTQGTASRTGAAPHGIAAGLSQTPLSPGEILKSSGQAKRMRDLLDTVEMMVKAGEIPAVPARSPIVPGTKGFGHSEAVISDYVASFNYWVSNGLEELADKSGRITLELASGAEVKVSVEEVQELLRRIDDIDNYVPGEAGSYTPPNMTRREYEILDAADQLFREEIELGYMNPAREAVEITNVLDAWQYLIRERHDVLYKQMGEYGYEYVMDAVGRNPARFVQRMEVLRRLLHNEFDLDNLETLRELRRLDETRPGLNVLDRELMLGVDETLNPTPKTEPPATQDTVEALPEEALEGMPEPPPVPFIPDPTPTTPRPADIEGATATDIAEVVDTPSTISPVPSTAEEVAEIVEAMVDETPLPRTDDPRALIRVVGDIIAKVTKNNITDVPDKAPFRSRSGAYRTAQENGEGLGWHLKKWNTQNQYDVEANIWPAIIELSEEVFKREGIGQKNIAGMYSKNRARWDERLWTQIHTLLDQSLNRLGVKQVLGYGEDLIPLSFGDIHRALQGVIPDDARLMLFHNGNTRANWTNVGDAVRVALWGGSDDEIKAALLNTQKPGAKGARGEAMPNNLTKADIKAFKSFKPKGSKGDGWVHVTGEELADQLTYGIREASESLARTAINNGWRMAERGATETYDLASEALQRLDDLYVDPTARSEFLRQVAGLDKNIAKAGSATGTYQDSVDAATEITRVAVGDDIVEDAAVLVPLEKAEDLRAVQNGVDNATRKRVKSAVSEVDEQIDAARGKAMLEANIGQRLDGSDEADALAAYGEAIEIYDMAPRSVAEIDQSTRRLLGMRGELSKTFNVKHGHEQIWDITHNKSLAAQEYLGSLHLRLSDLSKRYTREEMLEAFQRVQLRSPIRPDDELQSELARMVANLWDAGEDSLFSNVFLNTEKNLDYLNDLLKIKFDSSKQFLPQFDIGLAKSRAVEAFGKPTRFYQFLGEQWRGWKIEDPADFLSRMSDAALTLAERKAIVENFVARGKGLGWLSYDPKPGFVKVPHTSNTSSFSVFLPQQIDGKAVYYNKEIIRELHHADILTTTSRQMQGEMGEAVRKYFMPLQNAWKIAITIYRPGHHIRNAIGDASITWVKRGGRQYSRSMSDAFRVMAMRKDYTDVDLIKALKAVDGEDALPARQSDVIVRGTLNGQKVEITAGNILDLLHRKGLRPTYHMSEGTFDDALMQSKMAKWSKVISLQEDVHGRTTAFNKAAGGVSQARDHYARAQHFIQILHQELGKGGVFSGKQFSGVKSLDNLFDLAAAEVKKYHPDASMLTPRESKYFRVVVPFYSWFSKILPVIFESTLRHPGRVMAFPKASYNLAVANGVNPDSISEPFPQDQLFPSFLTEKALGPQFGNAAEGYFGVNPGLTHMDVFNTLGADPIRGILGMTSPLIRTPVELAAGGSLGTGARINDASDYLDESIPGVNYLSDIMGVSVTGSLGSIFSGKPGLDPQFQVAKGNKGGFGSEDMWLSAMNWATGLGIQDMSRPNYINYAELERKRGEVPAE